MDILIYAMEPFSPEANVVMTMRYDPIGHCFDNSNVIKVTKPWLANVDGADKGKHKQ